MAAVTTKQTPWTCPTCTQVVTTPYCAECGERCTLPHELAMRGLLRQLLNAISNIDARVLRTLRSLLGRPGALTIAWIEGPRKPFLGPIQTFLLANVVFVAAQSITGANVFSSTLESHLHRQDWAPLAQRMVDRRLTSPPTTLEAYEPRFDRAVAFYAKSLVIVMTIPFALFVQALFVSARRPFVMNLVFALHFYSFLLFLYVASLGVSAIDRLRGGAGVDSARVDTALTLLNLAVCAAYLFFAIARVYAAKGALRVAASLGLAVAVLAIALAYRLALLLLTLRLT